MTRPNLIKCTIGSIALLYLVAAFGGVWAVSKAWKGVQK